MLGLAIFCVYYPSLDGPFVFDDASTIVENPSIRQLWPLLGSQENPAPLTPPDGTAVYARPLVNLSFALNYYFGELDPHGYRAVNVFVHFLTALLLWSLIARTLRLEYFENRIAPIVDQLAFAAALAWALHPLVTESVVYVTQRTELLMGLCYLTTLYAAIRYWSTNRSVSKTCWLALATLACSAGMLCKEMIASAPAMVLLYERTFIAGSLRRTFAKSWPLYAGLALSWLVAIGVSLDGQQTPKTGFDLGVAAHEWWYTQAKVFFLYLKLAVWPWPLVIHYEVPLLRSIATAWPWLWAFACYAVVASLLIVRRSPIGYVMTWVVAVLSPTLLIPLVGETVAERRMYVPLAAIIALLVVGSHSSLNAILHRAGKGISSSPKTPSPENDGGEFGIGTMITFGWMVVPLVIGLGWLSAQRLTAYDSELTLWQDALKYQPDDPLVRANLGISLTKANRFDDAVPHFETWTQQEPDSHWAHYNLARAFEATNRADKAIIEYQRAVELLPDHAASHYNLARLLQPTDKWLWAIKHYRKAIDAEPDFADAHTNLGLLLESTGDIELAVQHFEAAVQVRSDLANYVNLTSALMRTDRKNDTITAASKSLRIAEAEGRADVAEELRAILRKLQDRD